MFAYVARQAIFDRDRQVVAYELLFRDGQSNCFPDIEPDQATSKVITDSHLSLGVEEITDNKTAYINFHEDTLLYRFPTSLDPSSVVIEIVETVPLSDKLIKACKHIKDLGYQIALDDHDFDPKWDAFLPHVHIIKIDISEHSYEDIAEQIPKFKEAKVKLVAERVETPEQFQKFYDLGFDFFQGYFFAKPETLKNRRIPTSKVSLIELMGASASVEFDFDKINKIIERDVSLSYMLLRFINNPVMNKRNKITSLRHALNYMGEVEVKKFIALLALANLGDSKPIELVVISLVRAKFCEMVAKAQKLAENPPKGFLVGLFSLLDAMLDQSMGDVMDKLPLTDELKDALNGSQSNQLNDYLSLVNAFEQANWANIKKFSNKLDVNQRMMHSFYNEAIKWGNAMKRSAQAG